jgi:outer membrane protein assembly factor BamC
MAVARATTPGGAPELARVEKTADGGSRLVVEDNFDRTWRRVGLALDRVGFTVTDRDRSKGIYFVRYADPESAKKQQGWLDKLAFWKDTTEKVEQYRISIVESAPPTVVVVQDANGAPDRTPNADRILALLKDQLK